MEVLIILLKIACILIPLLIVVAYTTYAERKIIGLMQDRIGPNRVGPLGLLQPIADGFKLFLKEVTIPSKSNRYLFIIAPMLTIAPAFAAWAVIPFSKGIVLSDINVGLLYILALASTGVYGVMIAGWASNSKYALLSTMRQASMMISYEIAMGFALIGVIMAANSMNLTEIVLKQSGGLLNWYAIPLLPLLVVYWICAVAETNRAPFDIAEGESEIVAGFHVEYSGITFAIFFLAEYANMILVSLLAAIMFMGGWLAPLEILNFIPGFVWLFLKAGLFLFSFLWFRATFPRYRYDQIMRLGWKIFIPLTLVWIVILAIAIKFNLSPWFV